MNESSYYEKRLLRLGITDALNQIELIFGTNEKGQSEIDEKTGKFKEFKRAVPIFRRHEKGIEIIVYSIDRMLLNYTPENSRYKKPWSIIRLEHPLVKENGDTMKYALPKGQNSFPFFPPELVQKYENRTPINSLILTEGFFKARKAAMHGIDIIGVPSITHLKNKERGSLHTDIIEIIKACKVNRVFWLLDGDCLDVTSKDKDLYKRPASFFASINTFKTLLDDYEVDKYFAYIDVDAIYAEFKKPREEIKGIDDLLCTFPEAIPEIIDDLHTVSKKGFWFNKSNVTYGLSKVRDLFRINNVNTFYLFHLERGELSKGKEFIFNGTKYKYNEEKGESEVVVPAEASLYFRVGDDYYKFVKIPNKYEQDEMHFFQRQKSTIQDDHGKHFLKHIPKYEAFCNVPNHLNYQQIIHNCFNVYSPLDYKPLEEECTEEDCPWILGFLKHIFGETTINFKHPKTKEEKKYTTYQLGLDYIQILYQKPWEKLPVLCLVSIQNNTGKSTFANLLRDVFGGNCAIVGNSDIAGEFNKHWSTKTIVICDETKIDKQVVIDRVKSLSTARKIMLNSKGKDHQEVECFIKFIFITNNEVNFIYATEEDLRYWMIKVPVIQDENPELEVLMREEIPAFLSYLNRRKLATEKIGRMWFDSSLLKTEALRRVIEYSKPTIEKELRAFLKEMFLEFGLDEILMARKDIQRECLKKYESNYIEKVITQDLLIKRTDKAIRYTYPRKEMMLKEGKWEQTRMEVADIGRPYIFKRKQWLDAKDIAELDDETKYIASMTPSYTNCHATSNQNSQAAEDELPF